MPSFRNLVTNVLKHVEWSVRDRFPNRKVTRDVQGVPMVLPWPHRLPDYAGNGVYGQNLVGLARQLDEVSGSVKVLDIGANVGDSTLQILHAANSRILCIEADPYYLEYLHLNVGGRTDVEIVEALLTPDVQTMATTAVRRGGTTRFTDGGVGDALASITPEDLRAQHPAFADLRLIKSDTDGYDVVLVPAVAAAWADARPVLFFEYDHHLSRTAGNDPLAVWPRLAALGYRDVVVWDQGGQVLGRTTVDAVPAKTGPLDQRLGLRSHRYWDVAVVHADDAEGLAALDALVVGAQQF